MPTDTKCLSYHKKKEAHDQELTIGVKGADVLM